MGKTNAAINVRTKPTTNKTHQKGSFKKNHVGNEKHQKTNWKALKKRDQLKKNEIKNKIDNRNAMRSEKFAQSEAERERVKQEKEERIKNYKKKRLERTKVISKKTQKGQPLMKDRMQMLLKQIEEMKRN